MLITKKEGKSKVHSRGFAYAIQKPSRGHYNSCIYIAQLLTVSSYGSVKQNPQDGTLELPFFFVIST